MINKQSKPSCRLGKKVEAKLLEIFNFLKNNISLYNVIKSTVKEEECCVANSKRNSEWQTKVKVYRLPRNLEERERWLTIIPGDNIPDTKNTVLREKHWPENYPTN